MKIAQHRPGARISNPFNLLPKYVQQIKGDHKIMAAKEMTNP
jgi:hypothetical protein